MIQFSIAFRIVMRARLKRNLYYNSEVCVCVFVHVLFENG